MKTKTKIIRTTTVPLSLYTFCRGLFKDLSIDNEIVAVSSPGKLLNELAKDQTCRCIAVPMERSISPLKDIVSLYRLIKVFSKEKPDMVHSMTPKAGLLSMMAAWITRVPVRIHTFTGLVFPTSTGLKRRILMLTDWITCACATHIIPEGEGVKQDLINNGITKKELKVLGYGNVKGIDLTYYSHSQEITFKADVIRKALEIEKNHLAFLFIGRLVGDKGIHELIEAFENIQSKYTNVHLILVGPEEPQLDPLKEETRMKISKLPTVHKVGEIPDVRPWYAAADVLVFPSYREGFPNVVIEAGAMNLPSIVTDINGSREIIHEGENGVIIPSKDIQALEKAMEDFILHPDKRKAMGEKARPMVAERYEQSFVQKCLKDFYQTVLEQK